MSKITSTVEYLNKNNHGQINYLTELIETIREAIPEATEKIAWGMPSWHKHKYVIHVDAYKDHVNVYVGPVITDLFKEKHPEYSYTTRGIQLYYDKAFPKKIIREMATMSYENEIRKFKEKKDKINA